MADTAVRVLVVDDEEDLRLLLRLTLGADSRIALVGEAGDGDAAVAVAHRVCPDVVVLDLNLPTVSGLDVIAPLLALPTPPRIVAYTAGLQGPEAVARGAATWLAKGDPTQVADVVVSVAAQAHTR